MEGFGKLGQKYRSKKGGIYSVLILAGVDLTGDLSDCLVVSCTNKRSLVEITGINYDRLTYVFTRKGQTVLYENDCLILRSNMLYKGRQAGGNRGGKVLSGYNRNK